MRKYKQNNTTTHHPTEQGKEGQYPTKSPGNGARREKGKEEQLQLHNSSHFTIVYDSKDLGCANVGSSLEQPLHTNNQRLGLCHLHSSQHPVTTRLAPDNLLFFFFWYS